MLLLDKRSARPRRLLLLLVLTLLLSGCWDRKEIEDMGFVLAMGVDKAEDEGHVGVTFQVAVPRTITGGGSGGGGGAAKQGAANAPPVMVERVKQTTIYEAIRDLETFTNRRISLVQLRLVIVGRDLAKESVGEHLGLLTRQREIRQGIVVMMADGTAEEALRANPVMEHDPSLFLEDLTRRAFERTARAPRVTLHQFLANYEGKAQEPVLPIVRPYVTPTSLVGHAPEHKLQMAGTAVIRHDRLACDLSPQETQIMLMLTRRMRTLVERIPVPEMPGASLTIELSAESGSTKTDVSGPEPSFTVRLRTEGELKEAERLPDSLVTPAGMKRLGEITARQLQAEANALVSKFQKECNADAIGFGRELLPRFLDYRAWERYNWRSHFPKARIAIQVESFIRRAGMTVEKATPH